MSDAHAPKPAVDRRRLAAGSRGFLVLLGALTAFSPLSVDLCLPALPAMAANLGTSLEAVQGTIAAFFLGMAVGQLVYGPLSDRYGRRRPLLLGAAVYTLASVACAISDGVHALQLARLVEALGGAAGIVVARAVVRDLYGVDESARIYSRLMLVMAVAPILAPLAGGVVLATLGWRAMFWILAGFGVAAFLASYAMLPETHAGTPGAARPLQALRTFASLLADRRFSAPATAAASAYAALFAFLVGSPAVLIAHYGLSPTAYALAFGGITGAYIGMAQVNARLVRSHGPRRLLKFGLCALLAVAIVELGCAATGFGGAGWLIGLWVLQLSAMGFIAGNAAALALADQGPRAGSAAALLGSAQFAAGGIAGSALSLAPRVGGSTHAIALIVAASAVVALCLRPWHRAGMP